MFCEVSIELILVEFPCLQAHSVSSITTRRPGGTANLTAKFHHVQLRRPRMRPLVE